MPFFQRLRYAFYLVVALYMVVTLAVALLSAAPHSFVSIEALDPIYHPLASATAIALAFLVAPAVAEHIPIRRGFARANDLQVVTDTASTLSVRDGRVLTVFDRSNRGIRHAGRLVGTVASVERVLIHEQSDDGLTVWAVSLALPGEHRVLLGGSNDSATAIAVAGRVASFIGIKAPTYAGA